MTTLKYERKTAKRNHKTTCDMTGVPIEKGDRYMECVTVDGREEAVQRIETLRANNAMAAEECKGSRHHVIYFHRADAYANCLEILSQEIVRLELPSSEYWPEATEASKQ